MHISARLDAPISKVNYCPDCGELCSERYGHMCGERFHAPRCGSTEPTTAPPEEDPVNHPSHYKQGEIECIDAIRAALTPEEFRGFCKGNILKYVWRERHKGGDTSLEKAQWYGRQLTEVKA